MERNQVSMETQLNITTKCTTLIMRIIVHPFCETQVRTRKTLMITRKLVTCVETGPCCGTMKEAITNVTLMMRPNTTFLKKLISMTQTIRIRKHAQKKIGRHNIPEAKTMMIIAKTLDNGSMRKIAKATNHWMWI